VTRPVDALLEFLEAEQARGICHVHLDDGARDGLRQLFENSRPGAKSPAPVVQTPSQVSTITTPIVIPEVTIDGVSKVAKLAALRQQAETWPPARSLGTLRETLVFATGNPDARLMLVGEAPGYQEEKEREPFVGPAGQKLNDILKAMGLSREEIYISTIVKFRPATPKQTTNNRKPNPEEIAACLPFLRAEVKIIEPRVIIALGSAAAEGLLGLSGDITSMREKWYEFSNTPVRVTYHPSFLLQTGGSPQTKRLLWEDMLCVMEKLELPISEKQRGFFLSKT